MKKIKNFFRNIFEVYNNFTGVQKLIFTTICVLILMLLVFLISYLDFSDKIINYKELNMNDIVKNNEPIRDRDIYIKCNYIIEELLRIVKNDYKINNSKISIDDVHKYALYNEYGISNNKFKSKLKNIYNDIITDSSKDVSEYYPIISNIYSYLKEQNMYIIEINNEDKKHYIGIQIQNDKYYIYYLE